MKRSEYIARIESALGTRKLIWIGTRGHDAWPLLEIRQFSEVYSLAAKLGSLTIDVDYTLEEHSGSRPDLDTYDFDRDRSEAADDFRRAILSTLTVPTAIAAYRPFGLLAALSYPRRDFVRQLAMFHERQLTFEHKPWVESELRRAGVRVLPWDYRSTEDLPRLRAALGEKSDIVFRFNRSDGGAGVRAHHDEFELEGDVRRVSDGFFAIAPLLEPHIALNVGGCLFRDGTYSIHGPSVQLIGIPECTRRRFGYCGNDFGAIKRLEPSLLEEYAAIMNTATTWLHSQGYLGAFGVDALVYDGHVYLTEVNPRFQGSSMMSARIDQALDRPDIFCTHLAAFLDKEPPPFIGLQDMIKELPEISHVICHNIRDRPVRLARPIPDTLGLRHELASSSGTRIEEDAILLRVASDASVTSDGRALVRSMHEHLERAIQSVFVEEESTISNAGGAAECYQ